MLGFISFIGFEEVNSYLCVNFSVICFDCCLISIDFVWVIIVVVEWCIDL